MMPVSRAALNKLIMNLSIYQGEGLSVGPWVCHDASVQASHGLRTNQRGRDSSWFGRNRYHFFDAISFII
jgi:hypothetical protein